MQISLVAIRTTNGCAFHLNKVSRLNRTQRHVMQPDSIIPEDLYMITAYA